MATDSSSFSGAGTRSNPRAELRLGESPPKMFEELLESVREGGAILHGRRKGSISLASPTVAKPNHSETSDYGLAPARAITADHASLV